MRGTRDARNPQHPRRRHLQVIPCHALVFLYSDGTLACERMARHALHAGCYPVTVWVSVRSGFHRCLAYIGTCFDAAALLATTRGCASSHQHLRSVPAQPEAAANELQAAQSLRCNNIVFVLYFQCRNSPRIQAPRCQLGHLGSLRPRFHLSLPSRRTMIKNETGAILGECPPDYKNGSVWLICRGPMPPRGGDDTVYACITHS